MLSLSFLLGPVVVAIVVILAFSLLILIHEFGHFIVAKKSGVWVEEFGLGLPPRIWGKKIGETIYSINLLPIGGFVKLHGEVEGDAVSDPKRSFINKGPLTRIAITLAGIVMNVVLAIICFSFVYSVSGIETGNYFVKITDISSGSPAYYAGLKLGDIITKIEDRDVKSVNDFKSAIEDKRGKRVKLEILRESQTGIFSITPRVSPPEGEGPTGVVIAEVPEVYFPPLWQRPFVGTYYGFKDAFFYIGAVTGGLKNIATDVSQGQVPRELAGPIAIVAIMAQLLKDNYLLLIKFIGIISVNLAVLNLIPFPPLDGSRVLLIIVEKIFGKKILPKFEATIHAVGMFILIALMVYLTAREIPVLIKAGSLSGFVNSIIK